MKWKDKLINELADQLSKDHIWSKNLDDALHYNRSNIHLAIFSEPFITMLLDGAKTLESRLSKNRVVPFGRVKVGDVILIKRLAGPIEGLFVAKEVKSIKGVRNIQQYLSIEEVQNSVRINADDEFSKKKIASNYGTFIHIADMKRINPISVNKHDRAGWAIIKLGYRQTLFDNIG